MSYKYIGWRRESPGYIYTSFDKLYNILVEESRSEISKITKQVSDILTKFIELEFNDRDIRNSKDTYICSLYNQNEHYYLENDKNNDDLIKVYVVEKSKIPGKNAKTTFNTNIFEEKTNIIVVIYLTNDIVRGICDKDNELYERYKNQLNSTIAHELEHCIGPTNEVFIHYFRKNYGIKSNFFKKQYEQISDEMFENFLIGKRFDSKLYNVVVESYDIYANEILKDEELCAITSELKIDSSRSKGKLNYFQLLNDRIVVEKKILEFSDEKYYDEFMEMFRKLISFVLEKYIDLSIKRYPKLVECLNTFEFDIYGKKYVFNVELNKLFARN